MTIVEGSISTKAVLESKYRTVNTIYIDKEKKSSDISYIIAMAQKKKIEVIRCNKEEIENRAKGKSHGGILAEVGERKMQNIVSLLKKENPFLACIEGVEDAFNLGYIFRTLFAFGCDGVIMKERYVDYNDDTIIKSSAGASELLPIVYSNDLETTFDVLKHNNIRVVSAYRGKESTNLYDTDLSKDGLMLCVGGPLRGLSKIILDNSDQTVYIPYANDFRNALNAASAVSVIASEIYRQKRNAG